MLLLSFLKKVLSGILTFGSRGEKVVGQSLFLDVESHTDSARTHPAYKTRDTIHTSTTPPKYQHQHQHHHNKQ